MNESIEVNLTEAALRAEEMLSGMTVPTIKLHDFATAMALMVGSMSEVYGVDNMILISEIENIAVQIQAAHDIEDQKD